MRRGVRCGRLLCRTGWDSRAGDQDALLNVDGSGPYSSGISVECAPGRPIWLRSHRNLGCRGPGEEFHARERATEMIALGEITAHNGEQM